jgi:hypothetical protein
MRQDAEKQQCGNCNVSILKTINSVSIAFSTGGKSSKVNVITIRSQISMKTKSNLIKFLRNNSS